MVLMDLDGLGVTSRPRHKIRAVLGTTWGDKPLRAQGEESLLVQFRKLEIVLSLRDKCKGRH